MEKWIYYRGVESWHVPSFDDAITAMLGQFGVSGGIIALVSIAFAIYSYLDPAKVSLRLLRNAGTALAPMSGVRVAMALLVTFAVAISQLLTIGLCYLGGNYTAIMFNNRRWEEFLAVVEEGDGYRWSTWTQTTDLLEWDWVSGPYVALAVLILIGSYRWTGRSDADDATLFKAGAVLALPATITLLLSFGLAVIVFVLLIVLLVLSWIVGSADDFLTEFLPENSRFLLTLLVFVLASAFYFTACQMAIHGSRVLVRVWNMTQSFKAG